MRARARVCLCIVLCSALRWICNGRALGLQWACSQSAFNVFAVTLQWVCIGLLLSSRAAGLQ
eukprot:9133112-Alexandrium_andersonii.AAC.1